MTCEFTRCLHGPHGPHALRSGHHPQRLEERNLVPGAAWGCSNSWSKSYQECFATYTSIHTWHCFRNEHETRCACVNGGHSVVTAVFLEVGENTKRLRKTKTCGVWSWIFPDQSPHRLERHRSKLARHVWQLHTPWRLSYLHSHDFLWYFNRTATVNQLATPLWLLLISHSYGKSPLFIDKSSSIITYIPSSHDSPM